MPVIVLGIHIGAHRFYRRQFIAADGAGEDLVLCGRHIKMPAISIFHHRYRQLPLVAPDVQVRGIALLHDTVADFPVAVKASNGFGVGAFLRQKLSPVIAQ